MNLAGLKRQFVTKLDPRVTLEMSQDLYRQAAAKLDNRNFFHAAGTALVAFNMAHLSAMGAAKRGMKKVEKKAFHTAEKAERVLNKSRKMISAQSGLMGISPKAERFISSKIKKLIKEEGYPPEQAVAIAFSMARKRGYKVPRR